MLSTALTRSFPILFLMLFGLSTLAQSGSRANGLGQFKIGNYDSAAKFLERATAEDKKDAEAWYYLGISYLHLTRYKDSVKALEKAIDIKPGAAEFRAQLAYTYLATANKNAKKAAEIALGIDNSNAIANFVLGILAYRSLEHRQAYDYAVRAIGGDPTFPGAYRLRSMAALGLMMIYIEREPDSPKLAELLATATGDLEMYVAMNISESERKEAEAELEAARYFADYYVKNKNQETIGKPSTENNDKNSTGLKVLYKPKPSYTDPARRHRVSGRVILLVAFLASGRIGPVVVLQSLDPGLDREAMIAAKRIKFEPATRDGVAITLIKRIEYTFEVY